jgi:hypothetical protein
MKNINFDELGKMIHEAFLELGWIIPTTEKEVAIAERGLKDREIPPLPEDMKESILRRIRERRAKEELFNFPKND